MEVVTRVQNRSGMANADHCMTDKARNTYVAEICRINVHWLPEF